MRGYFLLEDVFFLDKIDRVEHALVVDSGEASDDLQEEVMMGIGARVVGGKDLEDVSIQVEGVFEISDLILELIVLLSQHLLHLY